MATKKQKRAVAFQKHLDYMAELARTGLEAQRKDREYRERKALRALEEKHDKDHSWKNLDPECKFCQDKKNAKSTDLAFSDKESK